MKEITREEAIRLSNEIRETAERERLVTKPTWKICDGHDLFRELNIEMYVHRRNDTVRYILTIDTADGPEDPIPPFESNDNLLSYLEEYLQRVHGYWRKSK